MTTKDRSFNDYEDEHKYCHYIYLGLVANLYVYAREEYKKHLHRHVWDMGLTCLIFPIFKKKKIKWT